MFDIIEHILVDIILLGLGVAILSLGVMLAISVFEEIF
jgi:hypothetical protein